MKKGNDIIGKIKEFFRPTKSKVIITVLLSIMAILAFNGAPYLSQEIRIEDTGKIQPREFVVQPLKFVADIFGIAIDSNLFGFFALLMNYYLISCVSLFVYTKIWKTNKNDKKV